MGDTRPGKFRRIAFRILAGLGGFLLVLFAAVVAAGFWLEHRALRQELRFGPGGEFVLRVHGADFEWLALNLRADSLSLRAPAFSARAVTLEGGVDWRDGLLALRPAARLRIDTLFLRLRADTAAKASPDLDSLAFPDFILPLAARAEVRAFRLEDDSGFMLEAREATAGSRGGWTARARIGSARTRWTGPLAFSARASLDWSPGDSVRASVRVARDSDHVALRLSHARRPLWRGRDSVEVRVRDAGDFFAAFGLSEILPPVTDVRATAGATFADDMAFAVRLGGRTGEYAVSEAFTLGPQAVRVAADWRGRKGRASLRSEGARGEKVRVDAETRLLEAPADAPVLERFALSLRGAATGFRVMLRDTLREADLVVERADWDGRDLALGIVTGDSSRIRAEGRLRGAPRDRSGTFALFVAPDERWVKAFAGDAVSFRALEARGSYAREVLEAEVAARGVAAYGVDVDSLRGRHRYDAGGYALEDATLYARGIPWRLSGSFRPAERSGGSPVFAAELSAPGRGRLRVAGDADGTLRAQATRFDVAALPYAHIDSLPVRKPALHGSFAWNPARKTGSADLEASAEYRGEGLEVRVKGDWDRDTLRLEDAAVKARGIEAHVAAVVRLRGKEFWEVYRAPPADYASASLRIPELDFGEALPLFHADPPLREGKVSGSLSYAVSGGYGGSLEFSGVMPREAFGDLTLRELRLEGAGDELAVVARTASETEPLYNARLRAGIAGALRDTQRVAIELVAGDSLRLRLDATTPNFRGVKGTLAVTGRADLPGNSGTLSDVRVAVDFDAPAEDAARKASAATREFAARYAPPEVGEQRVTLSASLREGVLRVPSLRVEGEGGQALDGELEYALAAGTLRARLAGERFAAQWGSAYRFDLRALRLDVARDSAGLRVSGGFSEGEFRVVDAPLRAEGKLSRVQASYARPPAPPRRMGVARAARPPADLALDATLERSLVRYRLRSLADIQRVFRKENKRPSSGPPLRMNVRVRTLGDDNRIDSDIIRLAWVGDLTVRGTHPYTLLNGRVNSLSGDFGLERQAYAIRRLEAKWLNDPAEEGKVSMEARKQLASDCGNVASGDSCTVITRLEGELQDLHFTYDSDCGGAFGAGASVAAILYSVQRGCYDPSLATGEGSGYGSRALTLIESPLSGQLTKLFGRYTGAWIEQAEITGLGSLAGEEPGPDSLGQALSLGLTSREYMRFRLKVRSGYHTASQDLSNPWEHMLALEWRTPADALVTSPAWKRRLRDNLRLVGSLETRPVLRNNPEEDEIEKKIGLNYTYGFWGSWWTRRRPPEPAPDTSGAAEPRASRPGGEETP